MNYLLDDFGKVGDCREIDTSVAASPEHFTAYLNYINDTLLPLVLNKDYSLHGEYSDREKCYEKYCTWICDMIATDPTARCDYYHVGLIFENLIYELNLKMPEPISDDGILPLDLSNFKLTFYK
jgi:hypothetical protein